MSTNSTYQNYLQFGKNILSSYLSKYHKNEKINLDRAQAMASYLSKNHSEKNYSRFMKFYTRYYVTHFNELSIREINTVNELALKKIIEELSIKMNIPVPVINDKYEMSKYIHSRKFKDAREAFQNKYIDYFAKLDSEKKSRKAFENIQKEKTTVDQDFYEKVTINPYFNKFNKNSMVEYHINLEGPDRSFLVNNMRNYVITQIFSNMTFNDVLKVYYTLDDGTPHYEYFNASNISYLIEKLSNNNWDRITDEIYPSEGSDMLLIRVDMKRITNIRFIIMHQNNDSSEYKTRDGKFFKYTVDSYKSLLRYQIVNSLNQETVKIITEHCLVYSFIQAGVKKDIIEALKRMIAKTTFKISNLEELARYFNLNINLQFCNLDNNFNKKSKNNSFHFPKVLNENPEHEINLIVIDNHFMLNEKMRFNCNYYKHEKEISEFIEKTRATNSKLAERYEKMKYLFKSFNNKFMKFYTEESVPEFSIYEILKTLKQAGKFKIISISDYWANYQNIRYENIDKNLKLREPSRFETSHYTSNIDPSKIKLNNEKGYLVFADFEASTDGNKHIEYCICARKYEMNIKECLKRISDLNFSKRKTFNISDNFSEFSKYGETCAIDFLEWIDNHSIIFFHNLTYDINFILKNITGFKSNVIFHGKDLMHSVMYKNKSLIFKDSFSMINCKLSAFPGMFKLDSGRKEAFPYNYYNSSNAFNKYGNIQEALEYIKPEDKNQFIKNINSIEGVKIDDFTFDMEKYALFYCKQDVRILAEGLIKFNQMCREGLGIDCLNTLSISGLANKYFEEHVYFKNDNIYKVGGNPLKFMMKTVYGGRCMSRDNEMHLLNENIVDFDAVSLYPSAIKRAYILEGKPKLIPSSWTKEYLLEHLFEDDQVEPNVNKFISGFLVKIKITHIGKKLHMPLITNRYDETLPLNINECCEMYTNHITLQDLIRFQKIDFELIEGLYYDEKRDTRCQEVIQYLFNQRNIYKKQHNPIEQTFKLVMNSVYGKTIMKPINYKIKLINGEDKYLKFENKNYNHIYSAEKIYGSDTYQIKMINGLLNDFNLVQFGSVILSISKRIISEVFCLAEDLGFKIYYTDTDSGHFRECEINKLADEFKKIYGRDLIGSNLGQFHCDFNNIENNASMPVSVKSIFLGKKSYIDMLLDDKNNLAFHVRMKGIPASTLEKTANEMFPESISVSYKNGLFIPKINNGIDANYSIFNLYKYLYEHNPITFELVNDFSPRFQFNKNRTIESKRSFERTLLF